MCIRDSSSIFQGYPWILSDGRILSLERGMFPVSTDARSNSTPPQLLLLQQCSEGLFSCLFCFDGRTGCQWHSRTRNDDLVGDFSVLGLPASLWLPAYIIASANGVQLWSKTIYFPRHIYLALPLPTFFCVIYFWLPSTQKTKYSTKSQVFMLLCIATMFIDPS